MRICLHLQLSDHAIFVSEIFKIANLTLNGINQIASPTHHIQQGVWLNRVTSRRFMGYEYTKWLCTCLKYTRRIHHMARWYIGRNNFERIRNGISRRVDTEFEPRYYKTNKMSVRLAKTQISLGIPPSLFRVFAVRMKKAGVLSYPLSAQRRLIRLGGMPRLIWVFAGRTVTLLVLSCRGSFKCVP